MKLLAKHSSGFQVYDVYFDNEFCGQVEAKSEDEAWEQYESVIPPEYFYSMDPADIPDHVYVEKSDSIDSCIYSSEDIHPSDVINTVKDSVLEYPFQNIRDIRETCKNAISESFDNAGVTSEFQKDKNRVILNIDTVEGQKHIAINYSEYEDGYIVDSVKLT